MSGTEGFKPRRFQREFRTICRDIRDGSLFPQGASYEEEWLPGSGMTRMPPRIVLEVAAGAGKSNLAPILAAELLGRRVDAICWLVPRLTLQSQAEESFEDTDVREWLGQSYEIRQSTNEIDPCRGGKVGWASTHQAIEQNVLCAMQEFSRGRRYALFIDEAHHAQLDGALDRNLRSLVERAEILVLMSGMFARGNRKKIAFLRYKPTTDKRGRPVEVWDDASDPAGGYVVVRYPILDALRERAIKPIEFYYYDAALGWSTSAGDSNEVESFEEVDEDDLAAAIGTALETEFAHEVLAHTVDHWNGHRATNPRAKLLVVAKGITLAKEYLKYLRGLGVNRAGIATTEAPEEAVVRIGQFKREHDDRYALDCLVTVAMAYEGLNVPQITHVAALTHIRSTPWIYQMLSRANRIDHKRKDCEPHQQWGFAFAPRDKRFLKCAAAIRAQQDQYIYQETDGPGPGPPPPIWFPDFGRQNGTGTVEDLGSTDAVTNERRKEYEVVLRREGYWGQIPLIVLERAVQATHAAGETPPRQPAGPEETGGHPRVPRPPSKQREMKLRTEIQTLCGRLDGIDREAALREGRTPPEWGDWNRRVVRKYGKSRDSKSRSMPPMSEDDLEKVKDWLNGEYEKRRVKVDVS